MEAGVQASTSPLLILGSDFAVPHHAYAGYAHVQVVRHGRRYLVPCTHADNSMLPCWHIVQDIRRIVRNDSRILNKLHRRVFLDKITHEDVKVREQATV